jgi:EAL domain-containing protein (putative c-di-GMP-specific phosphodiesterase class I)
MGILREHRLETWYQPIVSAADGALWGYECLMRGRDADGSLIFPDRLIAWSRQEDLTFLLDRVCRETHLRNAAAHLAGGDLQILINFMPTAIYDPQFCLATTVAAAKAGGLDPGRIIFEVVETEHVADLGHLKTILDYYRRSGFRAALDDLGSGYSGLAMLGDLDPDLIKIDRHLIARAVGSPMHRSICAALAQLGRDHGKLVLAEGIETVEERDLLGGLGVDLFQGYLFGRPAPAPAAPIRP